MLLLKSFAALGLLVTSVLGDDASIIAALQTIEADTTSLNTTITNWRGDFRGYWRVVRSSNVLLAAINNGIQTAEASEPLDDTQAINVGLETFNLLPIVNTTLINFINAQPKFARVHKLRDALSSLQDQREASDAFSAAVIDKVPADLKDLAGQVTAPIDQNFGVAIANYTAAVAQIKKHPHWGGWGGRWGSWWGAHWGGRW